MLGSVRLGEWEECGMRVRGIRQFPIFSWNKSLCVASGSYAAGNCIKSGRFLSWKNLLRSLINAVIIFSCVSQEQYFHDNRQNKGPVCCLQTAPCYTLTMEEFLHNDIWLFKIKKRSCLSIDKSIQIIMSFIRKLYDRNAAKA